MHSSGQPQLPKAAHVRPPIRRLNEAQRNAAIELFAHTLRGARPFYWHIRARLEDTKAAPQVRPLGQAALKHLATFKPEGAKATDCVFSGPGKAGHYVEAPKAWARIAALAEIEGVSLLRHWFASATAEMGFNELVIGGLLRHSRPHRDGAICHRSRQRHHPCSRSRVAAPFGRLRRTSGWQSGSYSWQDLTMSAGSTK